MRSVWMMCAFEKRDKYVRARRHTRNANDV